MTIQELEQQVAYGLGMDYTNPEYLSGKVLVTPEWILILCKRFAASQVERIDKFPILWSEEKDDQDEPYRCYDASAVDYQKQAILKELQ